MKITHKQRILQLLESAGEEGIHSFHLATIISFRAAARIDDLRKEGHKIRSKIEKMGNSRGVRYILE